MDGWIGLDWIGCPGKRLANEGRHKAAARSREALRTFQRGPGWMDGWMDWIGCPGKRLANEGRHKVSRSFKDFPTGAVRVVLLIAVRLVQYASGTTTEEGGREGGREEGGRQVGREGRS
jgi:hypothetical protein